MNTLDLKHYSAEKLREEIIAILKKHLDLTKYTVFFFGSRAAGTGHERSDIDIGVDGTEPINPKTWLTIKEEIEELPTLYKIEIVDFQHVSKTFRDVALQHAELIKE